MNVEPSVYSYCQVTYHWTLNVKMSHFVYRNHYKKYSLFDLFDLVTLDDLDLKHPQQHSTVYY